VTDLFGDWHDPIPAILAATPKEAVLHNDILDLPLPLVPFVSGQVVLLGDAAHAMRRTSDRARALRSRTPVRSPGTCTRPPIRPPR
jgi:hypothetical protein